jgi:hypothetical protein
MVSKYRSRFPMGMTERKARAKAEEKLVQRQKKSKAKDRRKNNGTLQAAGLEEFEFGVQE